MEKGKRSDVEGENKRRNSFHYYFSTIKILDKMYSVKNGGGKQLKVISNFLLSSIPLKESFSVDPHFDIFFSTKQIIFITL